MTLLLGILLLLLATTYGFMRLYAPIGGRLRGSRLQRIKKSANRKGKIFVNQIETSMSMNVSALLSLIRDELINARNRQPIRAIEPDTPDMHTFDQPSGAYITWLGHSAFIVRLGGKTILLDPMLSSRASPLQSIGPKRFAGTPGLTVDALPPVDIVVISHDHYDHLDYNTIKQLAGNVKRFFVPLGIGAHLERWGVPLSAISEMDWWDEAVHDGLTFVCTPSRHFSGRSLDDRFRTLWASWIVMTSETRLYFSGDTGYGPHFAEIGRRYGPFDLTLLECGQYDRRWPNVHMMPEDTVRAHGDLGGKRMVPMHWGSFVLAIHDWVEPVERATKAALSAGFQVATPKIGETFAIHGAAYPQHKWWEDYR